MNSLFPYRADFAFTPDYNDMSLSGPRTALGLFTITVDRASTTCFTEMSVQHIVKNTAAEKVPDAILVTDLDMTKFVIILMMGIQYDQGSDQIEYWQPDRGVTVVPALQERLWQTAISNMYNRLSQTGQTEIKFTVRSLSALSSRENPLGIATPAASPNSEVYSKPSLNNNGVVSVADQSQDLPIDRSSPRAIRGCRWALVVSAILSSLFLFALDNTVVADVQSAIIETFSDIGKLSWLGVAFLLGAASTSLIWAKAYGQFNTKWTYILSLFLFETGSTVCGTANSMSSLIVGRAICGVGGVGMYIGVMTLLSMMTSIHERPNYLASTSIVWGFGTVLGPVVGGGFADSAVTWRWAFYINLCLGGGFVPVYLLLLPSLDPQPGKSFSRRIREMDILGGILLIGAFVSGIMAISFGGTLYLWKSAQIIGCFVVSGFLFVLFGIQQIYAFFTTIERRIFPIEFLKSRTMVLLFCSMSCASTGLFIPIYMVPLFFQFTRLDTSLDAAVRLLPFIFFLVFATLVNGAAMSIYGYYMPWYLAAGIFITTGATLMSVITDHTSIAQVYGSTILLGFGVGLINKASFSVAQAIVPVEKVSNAVGFITCAQVSSLTISLAIANSLFLNEAQNRIQKLLPGVSLRTIQGAIAGVSSKFVASLPPEKRVLVLRAIVQSMGKVYILGITAGAFLILLSLGLKRERPFKAAGGSA